MADEEEDLFPLLRRACRADDDICYVLELLCMEHDDDFECRNSLLKPLRRIAAGDAPADAEKFFHYARSFAMLQRHHLEWENVLVLPLAYARLSAADTGELARAMAARRGLSRPN